MAMTLGELSEALKQWDETTLLELLEISPEDIVERFQDKIEDRFDYLETEVQETCNFNSQGIEDE